jgi:hypothetical protein
MLCRSRRRRRADSAIRPKQRGRHEDVVSKKRETPYRSTGRRGFLSSALLISICQPRFEGAGLGGADELGGGGGR